MDERSAAAQNLAELLKRNPERILHTITELSKMVPTGLVQQLESLVIGVDKRRRPPLKVWKLARVNVVTTQPETQRAIVVIAETEEGARYMAAESAGMEGRKAWLDPSSSGCWSFGTADESYIMSGQILRDYLES
jgi:hypothetical protein